MNMFHGDILQAGKDTTIYLKNSDKPITAKVIKIFPDKFLIFVSDPIPEITHRGISFNDKILVKNFGLSPDKDNYYYVSLNPVEDKHFSPLPNNAKVYNSQNLHELKFGDELFVWIKDHVGNPIKYKATVVRSANLSGSCLLYIHDWDGGINIDNAAHKDLARILKLNLNKPSYLEFNMHRPPAYFYNYMKIISTPQENVEKNEDKSALLDKEKPSFMDHVKSDLTDAGYRIASTQLTAGIKAGILLMLKDKGIEESKISVLKDFLESEFGNALISVLLGYGLTYAPTISEDARVKKLATEFRVQGIATVGNEVIGTAIQYLMPAVNEAIKSLPKEEQNKINDAQLHAHTEDDEFDVNVEELTKSLN